MVIFSIDERYHTYHRWKEFPIVGRSKPEPELQRFVRGKKTHTNTTHTPAKTFGSLKSPTSLFRRDYYWVALVRSRKLVGVGWGVFELKMKNLDNYVCSYACQAYYVCERVLYILPGKAYKLNKEILPALRRMRPELSRRLFLMFTHSKV